MPQILVHLCEPMLFYLLDISCLVKAQEGVNEDNISIQNRRPSRLFPDSLTMLLQVFQIITHLETMRSIDSRHNSPEEVFRTCVAA
jgi:hypothetical protein